MTPTGSGKLERCTLFMTMRTVRSGSLIRLDLIVIVNHFKFHHYQSILSDIRGHGMQYMKAIQIKMKKMGWQIHQEDL